MVTFAQLLNAQPSSLAEAAETWELRAKDMGRRAAEIEAEVLGLLTRWSGSASQAAIQKLNELVEKLTDAHTAMQHVSDILDPAGRAITAAQADLVGAVEYAHRSGSTVEDDGSVSWLDWNPLEWGKDRETAQHASDLIQDALRRANEADAEAAADLRVAQFVAQDKASVSALSMSDDPQVEKAVEGFHELLDEAGSFELDGNRDKLQEITNIIQCLSPTEREAFLAQLSDEDLRTLQQHTCGARRTCCGARTDCRIGNVSISNRPCCRRCPARASTG